MAEPRSPMTGQLAFVLLFMVAPWIMWGCVMPLLKRLFLE